jgi:hypothetical protein
VTASTTAPSRTSVQSSSNPRPAPRIQRARARRPTPPPAKPTSPPPPVPWLPRVMADRTDRQIRRIANQHLSGPHRGAEGEAVAPILLTYLDGAVSGNGARRGTASSEEEDLLQRCVFFEVEEVPRVCAFSANVRMVIAPPGRPHEADARRLPGRPPGRPRALSRGETPPLCRWFPRSGDRLRRTDWWDGIEARCCGW